MAIKKHVFSENIKEIESLIEQKFKNELKEKFGHSNFSFNVKNININKFKRVFVAAVLDERIIEENREINYSGLRESRKVNKSDIDIFSYQRDNRIIDNVGKTIEYRVDKTNETIACGTCKGNKQITCSTCRGSGKNRCDTCNGQRQVKCSVWGCSGGDVKCIWCSGKGTKTEGSGDNQRTVRCSCNNGYNKCSSCNNGYNTCSTCNGNGEVICSTCNSSGKVDCYSCDAQGSFTKFLSVKSVLVQNKKDLVVSGNNPGDFISKNLIAEEFPFMHDFVKYKISELSDYKPQLKELFSGLLPNKMQEGCMIYASLDECASLTFEIVVGESTYLGKLKDGVLWFDNSVMSLLFYDVIDGMRVDANFSSILNNKAAFDGNLSSTDLIWNSINQYKKFEELISSKKNVTNKIIESRKFDLLNPNIYLQSLYPKFIKKEALIKTIVSIILVFISLIIFGRSGGLVFFGLTDFVLIPILALFVAILLTRYLIKKWNPKSVSVLGFSIILISFIYTTVSFDEKHYEFENFLYKKEQEQLQYNSNLSNIKNFKNFKNDKLIISDLEFDDLDAQNKNRSLFFNGSYGSNDSIIIVRPSEDLGYNFYIDPNIKYRFISNANCGTCGSYCYGHEKISDDQMSLNIGYNYFIDNSGYYNQNRIRIGNWGGFSDLEVSPNDIKFDVSRYAVTVMDNKLDDYTNNILEDAYLSPESFLKLFPNSDLVNQNSNKYYYFNSNGLMETSVVENEILLDENELSNDIDNIDTTSYIRINDPDGYTNVRAGKSSSTEIIHQIFDENKLFELIDDSGSWWKIKLILNSDNGFLENEKIGYIHKSKVLKVNLSLEGNDEESYDEEKIYENVVEVKSVIMYDGDYGINCIDSYGEEITLYIKTSETPNNFSSISLDTENIEGKTLNVKYFKKNWLQNYSKEALDLCNILMSCKEL